MGSSTSKDAENEPADYQQTLLSSNALPYNIGPHAINSNYPDRQSATQHHARNIRTASSLKMPIPNTYQCNQCGSIFPSDEALYKHRLRFCIGSNDSLIGRQLHASDTRRLNGYVSDSFANNESKLRSIGEIQSPIEKKRDEILEWKNQRSVLRSVQDMEDRILLDSYKTEQLANDLKRRTLEYDKILNEYEQLQMHERDLLRQMFNLQSQSKVSSNRPTDLTQYEKTQLEILQIQATRLKQERQIIQSKLEALIANENQSLPLPDYEPYRLLREMRDEQDRNEKTLAELRRRILNPNAYSSSSDVSSLPYIRSARPPNEDDSRYYHYRTLRNGYLQSAGHDQQLLTQYVDAENRMRYYQEYPWIKDYPEPLRRYPYRPFIPVDSRANDPHSVQNENERLKDELNEMQLKFRRLDSRTRQLETSLANYGVFDPKLNDRPTYPPSQKDPYLRTNALPNTSTRPLYTNQDRNILESRRNPEQVSLPPIDRNPYVSQPKALHSTSQNNLANSFEPQPYDETRGFVVFFDFVIHFLPSTDQCRLITSIHHAQAGLGQPSPLEILPCELYIDEKYNERTGVVLIATKQPVSRCPATQALTIVIEVQTTSKLKPSEPLHTNAWTKLPLFDDKNRLLNGRWKAPLLSLPIRPEEGFSVFETLIRYGHAELYYRIVHARDAPNQPTTRITPEFRDVYHHPPQD